MKQDKDGLFGLSGALKDIRVTRVDNTHDSNTEIFTTGRAKIDVVSVVVIDNGLGQHSIILNLGLSERRSVVGNEYHLG